MDWTRDDGIGCNEDSAAHVGIVQPNGPKPGETTGSRNSKRTAPRGLTNAGAKAPGHQLCLFWAIRSDPSAGLIAPSELILNRNRRRNVMHKRTVRDLHGNKIVRRFCIHPIAFRMKLDPQLLVVDNDPQIAEGLEIVVIE